jgi:hypothetical protein
MNRIEILIAEWTRVKTGVLDYIDAIPEDALDFRPTPDTLTFAEQMLHLAAAQYVFASSATDTANPYEDKDPVVMPEFRQSREALKAFLSDSHDHIHMIAGLQTLNDSQLDETVEFFKHRIPRWVLLAKALEH